MCLFAYGFNNVEDPVLIQPLSLFQWKNVLGDFWGSHKHAGEHECLSSSILSTFHDKLSPDPFPSPILPALGAC